MNFASLWKQLKKWGALPKLAFDEGISIRCSEKMSYNTYKRRKCKHEKKLKHIILIKGSCLFHLKNIGDSSRQVCMYWDSVSKNFHNFKSNMSHFLEWKCILYLKYKYLNSRKMDLGAFLSVHNSNNWTVIIGPPNT